MIPVPSLHVQLAEIPLEAYDAEPELKESHELQATLEQLVLAEIPNVETDKEHAQPPDERVEQLSEFDAAPAEGPAVSPPPVPGQFELK